MRPFAMGNGRGGRREAEQHPPTPARGRAASLASAVLFARALALVAMALVGAACSTTPEPPAQQASEDVVGVTTRTFHDDRRDRDVVVEVFYPAAAGARAEAETHAWIYTLELARDAEVAPGGRRPLVLLSHGTGGTRFDLSWLAQHLARAGYLVASVKHAHDTWDDKSALTSLQVWNRPQDLTFALDRLLEDATFGVLVDEGRVVAAGHSVGGYTVLATAGLRYDIDRAIYQCTRVRMNDPTCAWVRQGEFDFHRIDYRQSAWSYAEPRVKAVVAFTPAVAEAISVESAGEIAVPVRIIGARQDDLTPYELHAKMYASWVPGAELVTVDNANHYLPVTPCNALGHLIDLANCKDPPGLDRARTQEALALSIQRFFDEQLRRGPGDVQLTARGGGSGGRTSPRGPEAGPPER